MYKSLQLLAVVFLSFLFITVDVLSQSTLQGGITLGLGANIPSVHPEIFIESKQVSLNSGKNVSIGMSLLYSRRYWGLHAALVLSDRVFYNPLGNQESFLANYMGNTSLVVLTNGEMRFLAYFKTDSNSSIRYYGGICMSKFIELGANVPWQKSLIIGVSENLFTWKAGMIDLGLFYDFSLQSHLTIPVITSSFYPKNGTFSSRRNSILKLQLTYYPNFQNFFRLFKSPVVKTPRYTIE